jgi:hypothetical protein
MRGVPFIRVDSVRERGDVLTETGRKEAVALSSMAIDTPVCGGTSEE